jgi:hypothetical protein
MAGTIWYYLAYIRMGVISQINDDVIVAFARRPPSAPPKPSLKSQHDGETYIPSPQMLLDEHPFPSCSGRSEASVMYGSTQQILTDTRPCIATSYERTDGLPG